MYNQIGYYLISKVKLNVHYHHWEKALEWAEKAVPLLQAFANQPGHVELDGVVECGATTIVQVWWRIFDATQGKRFDGPFRTTHIETFHL